jgi:NAD(P)-dependent dehydrogenase (short-subunit alcohol dehydrogenase family)
MYNVFEGLKDKVCVITGGGGVLGAALSKGLASHGIKCAILVNNRIDAAIKLAEEIEAETGTKTIGVKANVLDKQSLEEAKKEINSKLGKIDILINGAGGNSPMATTAVEYIDETNILNPEKTFYGLNIEGFDQVFNLNFKGTLLPTMVFTTDMLENKQGVVLNISSMNAFRPLTKIPAYSAAKASINNFTEWLAVHLAKTGIRVNAVAPGFFLTQQNRFLLTDEKTGNLSPRGNKIISNTPMCKFGKPSDLIGTVIYLISDMSGFVTGVTIPVDGGFNAYSGV